jgi:hypothetical protein
VHNGGGERGGGIYVAAGTVTIAHNNIARNSSTLDGGGIYIEDGTVDIAQNSIAHNGPTGEGGGIYVESGTVDIAGNDISHNTAGNAGGGVKMATGLVGGTVSDNRFEGNEASLGSALLTDGTGVLFHHNMVWENVGLCALVFSHGAGDITQAWNNMLFRNEQAAILVERGAAYLTHNTIAYHPRSAIAADFAAALWPDNNIIAGIGDSSGSIQLWNGTLAGRNNLFWDNASDPVTGTDPLFGNPRFRDPARSDFHVRPGSAAIDQGVSTPVLDDIDGQARPNGAAVDVGADEYYSIIYLPLVTRHAH